MRGSRQTVALCLLGLSVCGKASTNPTQEKEQGKHTIEQPRRAERPPSRINDPGDIALRSPGQDQAEPTSALEHFQDDLDTTVELLTPFADGTQDPHARIVSLKETYEKLHPVDEFLTYYSADHRDEIPDETRQTIQKFRASASGLDAVLLTLEGSANPQILETFIGNTLDNIEDIRPVLRELDAPGDPP